MVAAAVFAASSRPQSTVPISRNSSEHFFMFSDDRKLSICADYEITQRCLLNPYASEEFSAEELIYNLFKIPHKNDASIGKLLMVLKTYGLQESDPRLMPMMAKIREFEQEKEDTRGEARDPRHWKLKREHFKICISESLSLISQTLQNELIIPSWCEFTHIIKEIYFKCKDMECGGKVADYIPQLGRMSPDLFGVALCTVDGQRYALGDSKIPFCVQSVSKAFNYAIVASELGADCVHAYVGQEPSGRLFNEICLDLNQKPHNPMVNSGAIIVTSLIQRTLNMADRFDHMLTQYRKISGGEYVGFNNAVFLSERSTADRNFALAYYMKENGCFPPETTSLTEALDFYFQLCSLEVTCESAAVMAATLANGGVCPITGERCIGSSQCRDVLSLMNSCGMYDYSGQFAFHVGLPAKSGVSGIMIVVVPNLLGLALWSPPLDKLGNSARGVYFCKELVQRFNFHNYDSLAHNESHKFDPRRHVGEREKDQIVSLLFAAKAGDLNTIRRMYMQGYDLEMADYDKRTALHLAASEGNTEVAQFLLYTANVRPDPRDRWNRTPLHDAKCQGHLGCIQLLEKVLSIVERMEDDEEDPFSKEDTDDSYEKLKFDIGGDSHQAKPPAEKINAKNMGSLVRKVKQENAEDMLRERANSLDEALNERILIKSSARSDSFDNRQQENRQTPKSSPDLSLLTSTSPPISRRYVSGVMSLPARATRERQTRRDSAETQRAESVERDALNGHVECVDEEKGVSEPNRRNHVTPKTSYASSVSNFSKKELHSIFYLNKDLNDQYMTSTTGNELGQDEDYLNDYDSNEKIRTSNHKFADNEPCVRRKTSRSERDKHRRKYEKNEVNNNREDLTNNSYSSDEQYHTDSIPKTSPTKIRQRKQANGNENCGHIRLSEGPRMILKDQYEHEEDVKKEMKTKTRNEAKNKIEAEKLTRNGRNVNEDIDKNCNSQINVDNKNQSEAAWSKAERKFSNGVENRQERELSEEIKYKWQNAAKKATDSSGAMDAGSTSNGSPNTNTRKISTPPPSRIKENPLKLALGKIPSISRESRSYTSLLNAAKLSGSPSERVAKSSEIIETIRRNMQMNVGNVSSSSSDSEDSENEPEPIEFQPTVDIEATVV